MVKAKVLKQLRRKIDKADKDTDLLACVGEKELLSVSVPCEQDQDPSANDGAANHTKLTIAAVSLPQQLPSPVLEQALNLFLVNMGDMYRNSSWGLDVDAKRAEFEHRKARYLLVRRNKSNQGNSDVVDEEDLVAFVHFRFEMDDDERPECVVLYVYEIQVANSARKKGIGKRLMALLEQMAKAHEMDKILLTVFKRNKSAMDFYKRKLGYVVDETSPQHEDYEILSKLLATGSSLEQGS